MRGEIKPGVTYGTRAPSTQEKLFLSLSLSLFFVFCARQSEEVMEETWRDRMNTLKTREQRAMEGDGGAGREWGEDK